MKKIIYLFMITLTLSAFKPVNEESKLKITNSEQIILSQDSDDCLWIQILWMEHIEAMYLDAVAEGNYTEASQIYLFGLMTVDDFCE